tara:strand:+ start:154945 stop:155352 length:408 start_codon:yes stop_codon:yes gene_type:complete
MIFAPREGNKVKESKRHGYVNDPQKGKTNVGKWVLFVFLVELDKKDGGQQRKNKKGVFTVNLSCFHKEGETKYNRPYKATQEAQRQNAMKPHEVVKLHLGKKSQDKKNGKIRVGAVNNQKEQDRGSYNCCDNSLG